MNQFQPLTISPVTLEGPRVRLSPMTIAHLDALCDVGFDPKLWRWIPTIVTNRDEMRAYIEDALEQSRKAILRIGAKEEGTFRKHRIIWDGRVRDTVYFSIIDSDWPSVKQKPFADTQPE